MLDTLRLEAAQVDLTLTSGDLDEPIVKVGGRYMPPVNEFIALRVNVRNLAGTRHTAKRAIVGHLPSFPTRCTCGLHHRSRA